MLKLIPTDMIYYSHVNEDNRVERQLLELSGSSAVVTVAGSGERVLALMDNSTTKKIIAVDLNKEALFLLELKIAVLTCFNTGEYFRFTGHHFAGKAFRLRCFEKAGSQLTIECKKYWEERSGDIEKGILYAGHFEIFLGRVRPMLNLFLGRKFRKIFDQPSLQPGYFPSTGWKILTWLFSQTWIYKTWGNKDSAFIGKGARSRIIPGALDNMIRNGKANSSFMAHLIFKGHLQHMEEKDLPPSLKKNVLDSIRDRLLSRDLIIEYYHGDLLEYVKNIHFTLAMPVFYSASDILSFEDHHYLEELIQKSTIATGNTIVWRSFLRNRLNKQQMEYLSRGSRKIEQYDNYESTGMYQVFSIATNGVIVNN